MALEDRAITANTRLRYYLGVRRVIGKLQGAKGHPDETISKWIEKRFSRGEGVTTISDTLSGLHHFSPWLRGQLSRSWRLFKLWRKIEKPKQAPPLPKQFAESLVARAIEVEDTRLALVLALGFWGMLRTGELMLLEPRHLLLGRNDLVLQLGLTKSGLRRHQDENVVIHHRPTLLLAQFVLEESKQKRAMSDPLYLQGGPEFRKQFASLLSFFRFPSSFRPYSLRRGGATAHFRKHGQMERTLIKGRWASTGAARQYIQEGLSVLAQLKISNYTQSLVDLYSPRFRF